ncbi:GAF domain-containing sensor histidine kinase [uncultured Thiodictyon sp.]|uniref:GAF domain-containing sensor histidine kinase n=1 Tax=uncultured Thiodictyon sp. TaxID=1846217 RepID=UPI0025ED6436|nr:GAF domain-containing sensor histidine kinase [uncultured Thiodictyon sp.]
MDQDCPQDPDDRPPLSYHVIGATGHLVVPPPSAPAPSGDPGRQGLFLELVDPADQDRVARLLAAAFAGQASEFEFTGDGPAVASRFVGCLVPCADVQGRIERVVGVTRDLAWRRQTADELRRLGRTHAVLSRCNRSLARALDERALLHAFCANLVEVGGYAFAWIGYAGRRGGAPVRLMAHSGQRDGAFAAAVLAFANRGDQRSACRLAGEGGAPVILRDLTTPSALAPWAAAALDQGYRSMIALPLRADGAPFGNFSIFADTPDAFDQMEVALLAELADDLAFGIQTVRARAAQAQQVRRLRNDAEREARGRLAATLHDGVGQTMQALNLGLKQARALAERREAAPVALLDRLIEEAGEVLRGLRAVSGELRPLFLERLSLLDAIRHQCSETAQRTGIGIQVCAVDATFTLDEQVKEQCFLAFREALSNAVRHAAASHVEVVFRVRTNDRLILAISDDGVGFDLSRTGERPAGLGLCMIRERAASVLGRACVRSTPGRGTLVRICVPLTKEPILCP